MALAPWSVQLRKHMNVGIEHLPSLELRMRRGNHAVDLATALARAAG
jgi:hypothetical protein